MTSPSTSSLMSRRTGAALAAMLLAITPSVSRALGDPEHGTAPDPQHGPQQTPPGPSPEPLLGQEDDVSLRLTLYAWLPNFNGDLGINSASVAISETFFDIIDDSDSFALGMGILELNLEPWSFQINGAGLSADFSETRGYVSGRRFGPMASADITLDLDLEGAWFEAIGAYRIVEDAPLHGMESPPDVDIDLYAGLRLSHIKLSGRLTALGSVTLPGRPPLSLGDSLAVKETATWVEPFVGIRAQIDMKDGWLALFQADVGAFGIGDSQFSWQVMGGVGHRWHHTGYYADLFVGYRALGQDYAHKDLAWDIVTHGPMIGGSITFPF